MQTGDKKTFKIVMIDDEPDSLRAELDEIGLYLKNTHNLELVLSKYKKASDAQNAIDQTTDIAFIDKNLNGSSGIDVIGKIRRTHRLLDVLIYSRATIGSSDLAEINSYGIVAVAQEQDQIIDRLMTLIDRNLAKWNDISYLRGVVISRIIEIEREIDDVLMQVFAPRDDSKEKFRAYLLENSHITLFAKQKILSKIAKPEKGKPFSINELCSLQEDRNLLAHCQKSERDPDTLILVQMGEEKAIGKDKIKDIFAKAEKFSKCLAEFKRAQSESGPTASA